MTRARGLGRSSDQPASDLAGAVSTGHIASAEVLRQLSATLNAFRRFKDAEGTQLDPWEEGSLSVTEQALERAWLAFSQLHAALQASARVV
ncbi:MAG: hypothetical protein CVU38_04935 [Chloroflexi bacterium HGW-Chloroflexi-1]|nr:MAG: hypothetical protein CVU38_04935 [Chloroflexi bacterium HGW-Chloroflexi-1]